MDILTLRVMDGIHKLGITEEEYVDIQREVNDDSKTGVYIAAIKREDVCICVCHDERHKIAIKGLISKVPKSRILFKTLVTFQDIPYWVYDCHRIAQYRASDFQVKHFASNIEELKDRLLKRFIDGYPKELAAEYDDVWAGSEDRKKANQKKPEIINRQLRAIYQVFGDEYKDEEFESRLNMPRIIKVWQYKNMRIALFQEKECWTLDRGGIYHQKQDVDRITYKIKTYNPNDKEFNYVNPGREVGLTDNSDYVEVWLDDKLFEKVSSSEMDIIQRKAKVDGWWYLTPEHYAEMANSIRLEANRLTREEVEEEANKNLVKNIKQQFEAGEVSRDGITFKKDSFEYEGIKVKGDKIGEFLVRNNIIISEKLNFNQILNDYIEYLLQIRTNYNYYPSDRKMSFIDGVVHFQVGKIKVNIVSDKNYTVNGYRIARDELEEVCKEVIGFNSQKEYDNYLAGVQKVSLKMQNILSAGYFTFSIKFGNTEDCCLKLKEDNMLLSFPVARIKDKNYITINNKKFSIKNVTSFFKLEFNDRRCSWRYDGNEIQRIVNQLYKAVHNLEAKDLSLLIKEGIANYRKSVAKERREKAAKVKRSKEFIENAVRITKARKVKKRKCNGWLVNGLSGMTYFVGNDLQVYTINKKTGKTMKYLCIVDDKYDDSEWAKNDRIAKRLLMLSKDVKVASEVYKNGDKMDSYWQEIAEV